MEMRKMDCIFCKIINGDIPSYTIYENEYVKCFLDVNPLSKGHTLIVPKKHFKDIYDIDYLLEQKKNGRIKHLGFSTHARLDTLKEFLNRYGSIMEFCQIQLNYLDWTLQDANEKVKLLNEHNIPIWVMEPVRGGSLAKFDEETNKIFLVGKKQYINTDIYPDSEYQLIGEAMLTPGRSTLGISVEDFIGNDKRINYVVEIR